MAIALACLGLAATIHAAVERDSSATVSPAASGYVNPKQCVGCHAGIAKTWRETGMARSFAQPRPENTVEDYTKNNRFYHAASGTYFEMLERGGSYYQRRYQIGYEGKQANADETRVDYFLGSAIHARAYLHRSVDGRLLQLAVTWYSEKGGYWGMAPGYDSPDHTYGLRPITYDCIFCHNGYETIPATHTRLGDEPVYSGALPEGIDCQRCHGPGQKHVAMAGTPGAKPGDIRAAIVNPARLNPDRQAEVCMQCHLQTTEFSLPHVMKRYERGDFSYKPGEPLANFEFAFDYAPGTERDEWFQNVSTVSRMRMSQCFIKSAGALRCTTCHDPHNIRHGADVAEHYNAVCRQCHSAAFNTLVATGKHTAAAGCIGCHMPARRPVEVVHIVKTDHFIQRNKPTRDLLADITERHETQANSYRGKVLPYYPNPLPAADELYLAVAQVRDKSDLKNGIPRLERAIRESGTQRPEPYFELASALQSDGQIDRAIAMFKESLRRDPGFSGASLGLGGAYKNSGHLAEAIGAFAQASKAAPDNPKAWNELGQAEIDADRKPEAVIALKRAVALDPEMPQAHNGLGVIYAQSEDFIGAEKEFREAVRILPNYGEAHGNLAGVLDLQKDLKQAIYEFDLAVRLAPGDAFMRFNYGAVLSREGRFDEARAQMEAAIRANANFAEAHQMLGRIFERQERGGEALREYREAVRISPQFSQAQLDLGAVLAKNGDKTGAAEHLRIAAGSSDPTLRAIAEKLLRDLR